MRRTLPLLALLVGCIPKHDTPRDVQLDMPTTYAVPTDPGQAALPTWGDFFDDPALSGLIEEALANNQELALLEQEIAIRNAEVIEHRGEFLPEVGIGAGAGVEKVGEYTSQGASDAIHEIEPGREFPEPLGDLHLGAEASWEVDVWKKLRNSTRAARYRYLSSIEGRNFAVTQLVAEIAKSYYELIALDNQLLAVQSNIELLQSSLEVVRLQKDAAKITELGVQRFEAELLKNQAREAELRQEIVEAENRINLLCGRFPQPIERATDGFAELEPKTVGAGVPTELLENRPDVRAAELELEAAKLDVKAARAAFYPSLRIDAEIGFEAFAAHRLLESPESLLYGAAANLVAPIFNRKAIKAGFLMANSREMAAVIGYERTVLTGYLEASNQLAKVDNLGQSVQFKSQEVERLQQAIETSNQLFRSARADWLEVLTTRREALESQMELYEAKQEQMSAVVDVYQALGGGWDPADRAPEPNRKNRRK